MILYYISLPSTQPPAAAALATASGRVRLGKVYVVCQDGNYCIIACRE